MISPSHLDIVSNLKKAIHQVIVGKDTVIDLMLTCLLAEGHLLIEDVPGVGKTSLASALAHSIEGSFQRVQFTSDLLPSDLIGINVFDKAKQAFEFHPGPLFANIVVADEINRSTPKTQSALLEAMQEGQISVDRQTHILPKPFMVIATQNPTEHHGTYPLPESQLDRFLMKINMGYPSQDEEAQILKNQIQNKTSMLSMQAVCSAAEVFDLQKFTRTVAIEPSIANYMISLIHQTRVHPDVSLGVSPRGSIALYKACQAYALVKGRDYVIPDDVKVLADPVLKHRIFSQNSHKNNSVILTSILDQLRVPM